MPRKPKPTNLDVRTVASKVRWVEIPPDKILTAGQCYRRARRALAGKIGRPPLPDSDRRVRVSYRVKPKTAAAVERARRDGEGLGQVIDRWAEGAP